jgi:hypothetical protein
MLDGLNEARVTATPTPSPALPVLTWDYAGASTSATFTAECGSSQGPAGMLHGSGTTPYGAAKILAKLAEDKPYYDRDTNTCASGASALQCAFYKGTVQRSVLEVGCAVHDCGGSDQWACVFTTLTDPSEQPY